jgi:pimeloyl-ACP methyl ester carboxylesterase
MSLVAKSAVILLAACLATYATGAPPSNNIAGTGAAEKQTAAPQDVVRKDLFVASEPGVHIFVREVLPHDMGANSVPILLIHGGGPGGVVSFDLPVSGYSVAASLAQAGHPVYIMDVRGWGRSSRPEEMEKPASASSPLVCSEQAATDIGAVAAWIRHRLGAHSVALVGWATGGQWVNYYVAHNDSKGISHIVTLNSLYPVDAPWELRDLTKEGTVPAYRLADEEGFLSRWTRSIPLHDKGQWRDPSVAKAYASMSIASDPTGYLRRPPSMRIPLCYWSESIRLSKGERLWDPAAIHVPILAIRGERDFWSRSKDLAYVRRAYVNAPRIHTVTIPGATHYLFLDRPQRGRRRFLQEVLSFLSE